MNNSQRPQRTLARQAFALNAAFQRLHMQIFIRLTARKACENCRVWVPTFCWIQSQGLKQDLQRGRGAWAQICKAPRRNLLFGEASPFLLLMSFALLRHVGKKCTCAALGSGETGTSILQTKCANLLQINYPWKKGWCMSYGSELSSQILAVNLRTPHLANSRFVRSESAP